MKCWPTGEKGAESMTVVCLLILAGIFWGDFLLKNYIEKHVGEWEERGICRCRSSCQGLSPRLGSHPHIHFGA